MPRTLSLLYPGGETEFWLTDKLFDVADTIKRNGQTWVVTSLGNFNRDGMRWRSRCASMAIRSGWSRPSQWPTRGAITACGSP
jgi:hypothetical protein